MKIRFRPLSLPFMAFKVSNETKVGALAAVSITFLVLGYNFLAGQGSLFSKKYTLNAVLLDVTEISKSTPVLYNGYKVGNVTGVELMKPEGTFRVFFVINEDIDIPERSAVKVSSSLLGGKALNLIFSNMQKLASNGETLRSEADTTLVESMSNVLRPLNAKINSIVNSLDSLLASGEINESVNSFNASLKAFTRTSNNASVMLEQNLPRLNDIIRHTESITSNISRNNEQISAIIGNIRTTSDNLAVLQLKETVEKATGTLDELSRMLDRINSGQGSLGMLANDDKLYNNLSNASLSLDKLLRDLHDHPAKYLPVPFTKRQRKKAMEDSKNSPD